MRLYRVGLFLLALHPACSTISICYISANYERGCYEIEKLFDRDGCRIVGRRCWGADVWDGG